MSAPITLSSGGHDASLLLTGRSALPEPRAGGHLDESFWKDVFDKADSVGMSSRDVQELSTPVEVRSSMPVSVGEPAGTLPAGEPGPSTPLPAMQGRAGVSGRSSAQATPPESIGGPSVQACIQSALPLTTASFERAALAYGADAVQLTTPAWPPEPSAPLPQAVQATWVQAADGAYKLYLRASGLTPKQALEAASFSLGQWPVGHQASLVEVVLNGQTIYGGQAKPAPSSFNLTC